MRSCSRSPLGGLHVCVGPTSPSWRIQCFHTVFHTEYGIKFHFSPLTLIQLSCLESKLEMWLELPACSWKRYWLKNNEANISLQLSGLYCRLAEEQMWSYFGKGSSVCVFWQSAVRIRWLCGEQKPKKLGCVVHKGQNWSQSTSNRLECCSLL